VYCALVAEDVRAGLLLAVNHSGDSDSTGTVCGSLLGAVHGETALPGEWLAELEGRGTILQLADDLVLELSQGAELHGPDAGPAWRERYPVG
jgi:ADP-ribosylglycohydrolase